MRIVFFGSGAFGVPTLESLRDAGHTVALVVTQPDRAGGRGRKALPTPVKAVAHQYELPLIQPEDVNSPESIREILSVGSDLAVVVAFGQRLGPELVEGLDYRAVNLHSSLLPQYRGAAPINWAILDGQKVTGLTIFRLAHRMDTGDILAAESLEIGPDETASELHDRLAALGPGLLAKVIDMFANEAFPPGKPQSDAQASLAPKLRKADGRVVFDTSARMVARRVQGLWSWPGATCRFVSSDGTRSEQVTLARALVVDEDPIDLPPGTITESMTVACNPGQIRIIELQPAGKRLMPFDPAYINGRHVKPGDRFESIV